MHRYECFDFRTLGRDHFLQFVYIQRECCWPLSFRMSVTSLAGLEEREEFELEEEVQSLGPELSNDDDRELWGDVGRWMPPGGPLVFAALGGALGGAPPKSLSCTRTGVFGNGPL